MDLNRNFNLHSDHVNHKSALQYPIDIYAYIRLKKLGIIKLIQLRGVMFQLLCQGRKVKGIDLDSYLSTEIILTFPSINDITNEVKKAGRGCQVNVSCALGHVKVDPGDLDLSGLEW